MNRPSTLSARFVISNTDISRCPTDGKPEYAFIGRSNVGKSSLINMLTGHHGLALTSATPGKTLLINHFLVNESWYIVDLPGYGYARRGRAEQERLRQIIRSYVLGREQLTLLFVLIDSRLEPQQNDREFIRFLGENSVPFAIVFTKADKMSRSAVEARIDTWREHLNEEWEELPTLFVSSSATRQGRDEILDYISQINRSLQK